MTSHRDLTRILLSDGQCMSDFVSLIYDINKNNQIGSAEM